MLTHDMWPPSPPDGYEVYEDVPDTIPDKVRALVHAGVAVAIVLLLYVAAILPGELRLDDPVVAVAVVIMVLVVTVIHEGVHALVSKVAGWETEFRIEWNGIRTAPTIQSYGEFQERRETLLFYLAPALTLTSSGAAMLVFGSPIVTTVGVAVLITAWAGSVEDFYNVWFVSQLPSDSVEYHTSKGDIRYYAPSD